MTEKVLLALSDLNLAKVLSEELTKANFAVDIVVSGGDVIPKLKEAKSDILLIDTILPDENGYDVLSKKSLDKDVTKIPVIIISNSGAPVHVGRIPSTPMVKDYIVKAHVDPLEVIEKIHKVFGRSMEEGTRKAEQIDNGKKILWVEDDRLLSTILSKKLTASGYTLLKANDANSALTILETETPNLMILDIMLPGMNGLELLQRIKTYEKFKSVPVIILSNTSKPSYVESAKALGANRFLVKAAVSLDEIMIEVKKLVK
jgi:DNA-binding response OmpR family regulator